jgi:hypothetical protein
MFPDTIEWVRILARWIWQDSQGIFRVERSGNVHTLYYIGEGMREWMFAGDNFFECQREAAEAYKYYRRSERWVK